MQTLFTQQITNKQAFYQYLNALGKISSYSCIKTNTNQQQPTMKTTLTSTSEASYIISIIVLMILIVFLLWKLYFIIDKRNDLQEEVKDLKRKLSIKKNDFSLNKHTAASLVVTAGLLAVKSFLERRKEKKAAKELAQKREIELVKAVSFGWSYASFSPNKKYTLDECVDDYRNKFNTNQH